MRPALTMIIRGRLESPPRCIQIGLFYGYIPPAYRDTLIPKLQSITPLLGAISMNPIRRSLVDTAIYFPYATSWDVYHPNIRNPVPGYLYCSLGGEWNIFTIIVANDAINCESNVRTRLQSTHSWNPYFSDEDAH